MKKESSESKYYKILTEKIASVLANNPHVAYVSRSFSDVGASKTYKPNKDNSIMVDFLADGTKVAIEVYCALYYSIDKNVPEIAYEIQKAIKKDIQETCDYEIKNINVIVVGVLFK